MLVILGSRVGRNFSFRWKGIIQVTFMYRPEIGEGASHLNSQWESILNRKFHMQRS